MENHQPSKNLSKDADDGEHKNENHIIRKENVRMNILVEHENINFLWGSPPMLSSNWLSSGPYGTMYCVSVQCNACTYYSLFVWLMELIKPKPAIYMRE